MFQIDQRSSTPIYRQLIHEIKESILRGVLKPGDKLPSVRELAVTLTVNPNTIQKSYRELERQKIIETLRGRGTFVCEDYKPGKDQERLSALEEEIRMILVRAHYLGLRAEEIMLIVRKIMAEVGIGEGEE